MDPSTRKSLDDLQLRAVAWLNDERNQDEWMKMVSQLAYVNPKANQKLLKEMKEIKNRLEGLINNEGLTTYKNELIKIKKDVEAIIGEKVE